MQETASRKAVSKRGSRSFGFQMVFLGKRVAETGNLSSRHDKGYSVQTALRQHLRLCKQRTPWRGPSPPLTMPASPQLLGEAEESPYNVLSTLLQMFILLRLGRGRCAHAPSSSPDRAASVLGRGGHVPGPRASVCSAGHRLLRRVWKPSPGPERPVWAYTGPAPASPSPRLACTGRCSLPDCVA